MFETTIKQIEPETVAYLGMTGAYEQIPSGYGRLYGWVQMSGLTPAGMPSAVYLSMPEEGSEEEAKWELRAPITVDADEREPNDEGLGVKLVPSRTVASAMHEGPYEAIESTYRSLIQWIADEGYEIVGPYEEVYLTDPEEVPPEEYLTEARFPVRKK